MTFVIKKIHWAIIIVAFLVTIPFLLERIEVEKANDTYEIAIPFTQIEEMGQMLSLEKVLEDLKDAGLKTIAVEPVSLWELEKKEYILGVDRNFLVGNYPAETSHLSVTAGLYYKIVKEHPFLSRIPIIFDHEYKILSESLNIPMQKVETLEIAGDSYLFIPSRNNFKATDTTITTNQYMVTKSLGYDFEQIEQLASLGFSVMPRIGNDMDFFDNTVDQLIKNDLLNFRNYSDKVLFLGGEVLGFPSQSYLGELAKFFKEHHFTILTIENFPQKGMGQLVSFQNLDENVVRLFSITPKDKGFEGDPLYVDQAIRALKERNIRVLFYNPVKYKENSLANLRPYYGTVLEAKTGFEGTISFLQGVQENPRNTFESGLAEPFMQLERSGWMKAVVYIGGLALASLFFLSLFSNIYLRALAIGGFAVVLLAQLVTGHHLLMKAIVLFVALIGPIYAVTSVNQVKSWLGIIGQYVKSALIALISAWFVISVLYGTEYIVKLDGFSGVKLLASFPVFVAACVILYRMMAKEEMQNATSFLKLPIKILNSSIKVWHVFALVIAVVGLWFLIGRTGNQGIPIPGELFVRQWLEETLVARPRTKEFLIGFPLFTVGLYFTMLKKKWASIFLIIGALGFASMVGTFTHIHTPLLTSLLRTFNSLVLGLGLGIVLVGVLYFFEKKVLAKAKGRFL